MKCPYCGANNDKVIDKREIKGGTISRRRRLCLSCGRRFTTYEKIFFPYLLVIKRDGSTEPYSLDKIRTGVEKALEKRPFTDEDISKLVKKIDRKIKIKYQDKVRSKDIGKIVLEELKKLDEVAYLRFASVHKKFEDISSFEKELKKLKGGKK